MMLIFAFACKKDEKPVFPTVTTKPIVLSESNFATGGGSVSTTGNVEVTQRGVVWSLSKDPTLENNIGFTLDGEGTGDFNSTLISLSDNNKYYVRAYAKTSLMVIYGNNYELIVIHRPIVQTKAASEIKCTSAILSGLMNPNIAPTIISFEFGREESYGTKVSFPNSQISGNDLYMIWYKIDRLQPNTIYHFRMSAVNEGGIALGEDKTFKTDDNCITDYEGNVYSTVTIGSQVWMKEDLRTKHFNNGDQIPNPVNAVNLKTQGYWTYHDLAENKSDYGFLYNFYAASDIRNVCPMGWHIPIPSDFTNLFTSVGTDSGAIRLKETGPFHWLMPNNATNKSKFSALPAGRRTQEGDYSEMGINGFWWSQSYLWIMNISGPKLNPIFMELSPSSAASVRCIKGNLPLVKTTEVTDMKTTSVSVHGLINANGVSSGIIFEYGTAVSNTFANSIQPTPASVSGSDITQVDAQITGLIPGTTYNYRIKAIYPDGVIIGGTMSFTTFNYPVVNTLYANVISPTSVILAGKATTYFLPARISFEYGTSTSYTNRIIVDENHLTPEKITATLSDLQPGTTYHYRMVAEYSEGIYNGNDLTFITFNNLGVTDLNGNYYQTITIGDQVWMAANLMTTKLNDGSKITVRSKTNVLDSNPGYAWQVNDSVKYKSPYGALYNWYAVNTGKLCPTGWHVPVNTEWEKLEAFLGSNYVLKMSEGGSAHWTSANKSTNESSFSAIPAGSFNSEYFFFISESNWWTLPETSSTNARVINLHGWGTVNVSVDSKTSGYAVRCVKD